MKFVTAVVVGVLQGLARTHRLVQYAPDAFERGKGIDRRFRLIAQVCLTDGGAAGHERASALDCGGEVVKGVGSEAFGQRVEFFLGGHSLTAGRAGHHETDDHAQAMKIASAQTTPTTNVSLALSSSALMPRDVRGAMRTAPQRGYAQRCRPG